MLESGEISNAAVADWPAEDVRDIAATRAGDGEAFRNLIRRYQEAMAVQMRRFSRDPRVSEELVHDVFVEAYLSLHSYRGSAPWLHWLRRIAVRIGYRFWKQQQANRNRVQLSADDWQRLRGAIAAPCETSAAAELVVALLDRLPPADRLILTLVYFEDCSLAEAAAQAGWTVMGAKLRAFRARKKLKRLIERGDS